MAVSASISRYIPRAFWSYLRKALPLALKNLHRRKHLLLIGLGLMIIGRLLGLVLPTSMKYLVDEILAPHRFHLITPFTLIVGTAVLAHVSASFSSMYLIARVGLDLIFKLRCDLQRHIMRLPIAFHDANATGSLVSRVMSDTEGVRHLVGTGMAELIGALLTAVFTFIVMLKISPLLAFFTVGFAFSLGFFLRYAFRTLRPLFREQGRIRGEVSGRLTESFSGIRTIRCYGVEQREEEVFAAGAAKLAASVLRSQRLNSLMISATILMVGVTSAMTIYLGSRQVLAGLLTLGDFVAFAALIPTLSWPVYTVVSVGTQITEALAGLDRALEIFTEKPLEDDPRRTVPVSRQLRGSIAFEDIHFHYRAGEPILQGITFHAAPGSVTALVGPSGGGKSTIIGLLAGFYHPTNGVIRIDETDLSTINLTSYRARIAVVLQECFLFDGSIKENVAFGRPAATAEEIGEVCRIARVDEFVDRLDDGYETPVGERGVKLSAGQRQRIAIARAILASPQILLLDEAMSNLDYESEAYIQAGLKHLMKRCTTVVIAHRASTVRQVDQILVLESGRLCEIGTHQDLYAKRGRYYEIYRRGFNDREDAADISLPHFSYG